MFFLVTKRPVSFPLEDKHVVNEHYFVRKSHDATQKKCHHVVHFNVPRDRFETNSRHENVTLKTAINSVGVAVYGKEFFQQMRLLHVV